MVYWVTPGIEKNTGVCRIDKRGQKFALEWLELCGRSDGWLGDITLVFGIAEYCFFQLSVLIAVIEAVRKRNVVEIFKINIYSFACTI